MTRRRRKETHSQAFWSRVARIEPQVIRRGVPVCESGEQLWHLWLSWAYVPPGVRCVGGERVVSTDTDTDGDIPREEAVSSNAALPPVGAPVPELFDEMD